MNNNSICLWPVTSYLLESGS